MGGKLMQVGVTNNLHKYFGHHNSSCPWSEHYPIFILSIIGEHKWGFTTIYDKIHQDWDYMPLQEFPYKSIHSNWGDVLCLRK